MTLWALADLHLSYGVPEKTMEVFGPAWKDYGKKIKAHWEEKVSSEDLVLIPGDISWAMDLETALIDLRWIDALPGTKVMIKGNHDYWWPSASKLRNALPPSMHIIQNDAFTWGDVAIGGTRLWDNKEFNFADLFGSAGEPSPDQEKIFLRELQRLEMSLRAMQGKRKVVMTHYPPVGTDLAPTRTSALLEKYGVEVCAFGHLHGLDVNRELFGKARGVDYILTACDYLAFQPRKIF